MKTSNSTASLPHNLRAFEQRLGPVEYRFPSDLKLYEGNPNKHPEKQLVKLAANIRDMGFLVPVLVDEDDMVIAGEARVLASRRLKLAAIPIITVAHLTQAQVRAFRIADNKLSRLATFDQQALAIELAAIVELDETPIEILGFETAEVDLLLEEAAAAGNSSAEPADIVPGLPECPVSKRGDLWRMGKHRLLCGSSLEAENWTRLMAGNTAAMIFCDFPYNVPIQGHVSGLGKVLHSEFQFASGEMSRPEFIDFLTNGIAQMAAALKDGGVLTLAMDWRHSIEILTAIEKNSLSLLNMCVYDKGSGGMGSLYRSQHELFWIAKKGKAPHTNCVELGKHGRYRTNCWRYPGANSFGKTRMQDLADHPTVKPRALVADAIRDVTHVGEIVVDGFIGSGTTILAAELTKRIGYGIEIEPGYIDVAIRRWQDMTGGQAVLDGEDLTFAEVAERRSADRSARNASEPSATELSALPA